MEEGETVVEVLEELAAVDVETCVVVLELIDGGGMATVVVGVVVERGVVVGATFTATIRMSQAA